MAFSSSLNQRNDIIICVVFSGERSGPWASCFLTGERRWMRERERERERERGRERTRVSIAIYVSGKVSDSSSSGFSVKETADKLST